MVTKIFRRWFGCRSGEISCMVHVTSPEIKAQALLERTGFKGVYPVPLVDIIEYLGYQLVFFKPNSADIQQISGAVDKRSKKIYINREEDYKRQAFTMAHEIGHIELHEKSFIDFRSPSITDPAEQEHEREADEFAANLLMPEDDFSVRYQTMDVRTLSDYFFVGLSDVVRRAAKLRLAK